MKASSANWSVWKYYQPQHFVCTQCRRLYVRNVNAIADTAGSKWFLPGLRGRSGRAPRITPGQIFSYSRLQTFGELLAFAFAFGGDAGVDDDLSFAV